MAFHLKGNGAVQPWFNPSMGNANVWDDNARATGYLVNKVPMVGSIIQWDPGANKVGSDGHVAYVDAVTDTYIDISEDAYLTPRRGRGCIGPTLPSPAPTSSTSRTFRSPSLGISTWMGGSTRWT